MQHHPRTRETGEAPAALLRAAIERRRAVVEADQTQAYRVFSGAADGIDGVFIDVYGPGAVLILYEGRPPRSFDANRDAPALLDVLRPLGVQAIYLKPFARDRSRLGGELPAVVTQAQPLAGEPLPEELLIREGRCTLEVRLYDGLSTGLFLDQRNNRLWAGEYVARLATKRDEGDPPAVLNTFAYTCAFSVATAIGGAVTTSVDVSGRYLEWGKRNLVHNGIDPQPHRFAKMDTFEFFSYARRKSLTYDLILLDPPSFGSGSKKKGIRPWSAESDYHRLVKEAAALLRPGGVIFASTNTGALCRPGQLEREIGKALGRSSQWIALPPVPTDFARESDRFVARAFRV
ncbi:MAG TPA: class I SAM-dependent methyltransferase [Tepidisphaeraceae bacterium]|jgi:23S rRNA (cytosine1962-C5)-methyltransferase|nr:class I SAM-dependent methyltransferase [Tepidisphaeraceae bacterium]